MGEIKLLDCTLRDGGYINDWRFGSEAIPDMIEKLQDTGVDILEIGFLKKEPYQEDRTVFNSMEQVKKLLGKKRPGQKYAVMSEVVNPLPLDMIDPADDESADIIRVIVWKTKHNAQGEVVDALEEGFRYCKGIVEKGYKLCVQPARVSQYSDEEFTAMVRRFSELDPLAIYVVDSWGTQNAEELLHYMHLADENMPAHIAMGYHGHNNMMQALSVAQCMIKEKFERDIFIDASVYGIGRGAGNLNLEIIAKYMNEHCGKDYKVMPMLEVDDKYIRDIYKKESWGYSVPYFLTAMHNCNPAYARAYANLPPEEMKEIIEGMSETQRVIYKDSTAKELLTRHREKKTKLAVIIPTYNREKAIEYWLYVAARGFQAANVDIIIFDGSTDFKTQTIVKNFQIDGFKNVKYERNMEYSEKLTPDELAVAAYRRFAPAYDYVWVHGDDLVLLPEVVMKNVSDALDEEADVIVATAPWRSELKKLQQNKYTDCGAFFEDCCQQMTYFGSTIVRSETILKTLDEIPPKSGRYDGMWQTFALFEYFASHTFSAECFSDDIWIANQNMPWLPKKDDAMKKWGEYWYQGVTILPDRYDPYKDAMKKWGEYWYQGVTNLPDRYDPYKPEVLRVSLKGVCPFSMENLIKLRAEGSLSNSEVSRLQDHLSAITDTSVKKFRIAAAMPKKLAGYLSSHGGSKLTKIARDGYYIAAGIVPGEKEIES